ncbi:MAG: hypothetical protein Q4F15_02065 [Bacillota bacterium]|nr:hypothetical protein [Bacillota bacterium]
MKRELTQEELRSINPGEAITLTAVMAILAIAVMAVVVYRMFKSDKGMMKLPGGYQFSWN